MAFTTTVHQASSPTTFNATIFAWKEAMVAAGWRVLGSSNTVAFTNTITPGTAPVPAFPPSLQGSGGPGDIWIDDTFIIRDVGSNRSSWIRFKTPETAVNQREYLFALDDQTGLDTEFHSIRWMRSLTANGFNQNADSATPPDATDQLAPGQITPAKSGINTVVEGRFMHPDTSSQTFFAIGDAAEDFDFLFWTMRDSINVFSAFGQNTITNFNNSWGVPDPDPAAYICVFRATDVETDSAVDFSGGNFHNVATNSAGEPQEDYDASTPSFNAAGGIYASIKLDSTSVFAGTYQIRIAAPIESAFMKRDPESGHVIMNPVIWATNINNWEFQKGVSTGGLIKFPQGRQLAPNFVTAVTQTPTNDERKLIIERVAFPWPTDQDFEAF